MTDAHLEGRYDGAQGSERRYLTLYGDIGRDLWADVRIPVMFSAVAPTR